MPDIVLTTLNARYAHAAFGLRYLMANLGALAERARILEFDISTRATDVLEILLAQNPKIIGLGVYIWNASQALELVANLKRVRPDVVVVLGGPEVSYETQLQEICRIADYVITGEADLAFGEVCERILSGRRPLTKVIAAELPQFAGENAIALPYHLYSDEDIANRVIYVEASRGCPFKCEFCLSSLDVPVRNVPLDAFLRAMQLLLDRGVRQFKFVDRTFNLNLNIGTAILEFFLQRYRPGMFLHLEMIPDRLPEGLRDLIRRFPPGALQFEVGIQTFNEDVSKRISRRQDNAKLEENLRFLRSETGVHVHTDLIVGLPGEDINSFANGFDRLVAMNPQEIQVGMLKRLRGTPIVRHDAEWGMVYSPHAPYEVLATKAMDFATMQRMRRFSRYWDLYSNSGNFRESLPLLWERASPFWSFIGLCDWFYAKLGRTHGIGLNDLAMLLVQYHSDATETDSQVMADAIRRDYERLGRRPGDLPHALQSQITPPRPKRARASRQARHLA